MYSLLFIFVLFSCYYCADDYYSKESTKEYWRPTTPSYWEKIKPTTSKDDKHLLIQTTYAKPYYVTGLYTIPYYVFGEFANVYQRPPFGYPDVNYFNYNIKKQNKDKQYVPSYKA
ncbi:unnamed protein product [Pieris macdunnoughi]|uniref:Kappa-casein n=1 Tax=Pieris macdunnoughi TaxID=345717 RepID=A0A821PT57_9NEOP|nr:unnamed protein product [Pieris macdunnoughi]